MDEKTIKSKIEPALKKLIENDKPLLIYDANERSITHMLALYLRDEFHGYDVDCEYNRNIDPNMMDNSEDSLQKLIKKIKGNPHSEGYNCVNSDDTNGITVYPDIIIHKRCRNDCNLIAIEVKKTTSEKEKDNFDRAKLKEYSSDGTLHYKYSLFIKINTLLNSHLESIIKKEKSHDIGISKLELRDRTDEKCWDIPSKLTANINKDALKSLFSG
jgi:hypothetical protein